MQNQPHPRDDGRLRTLLRESWPAPPLPPRFPESVWRRIERAETSTARAPSALAGLERWVERLLVLRFALASLTLLLAAGGLTGVITSTGTVKKQAQERYLSAVAPNPLR